MKKLFTATILLLLQGCIYQTVDETDIKLANEKCKNNQGVGSIHKYAGISTVAVCRDGIKQSFSPTTKELSLKNEADNLAIKK